MGKVRCLDCGDIIESTHRHDFVTCSCGESFVDGGDAYLRTGGNVAIWEENSQDFLLPLTRDEELAKALKDIDDYYDAYQEDQWSAYNVTKIIADDYEEPIITNVPTENAPQPHTANLTTRYRYRKEGAQYEAERILGLLNVERRCRHSETCPGTINIYEHVKLTFGIDLEKLINGEEDYDG